MIKKKCYDILDIISSMIPLMIYLMVSLMVYLIRYSYSSSETEVALNLCVCCGGAL